MGFPFLCCESEGGDIIPGCCSIQIGIRTDILRAPHFALYVYGKSSEKGNEQRLNYCGRIILKLYEMKFLNIFKDHKYLLNSVLP